MGGGPTTNRPNLLCQWKLHPCSSYPMLDLIIVLTTRPECVDYLGHDYILWLLSLLIRLQSTVQGYPEGLQLIVDSHNCRVVLWDQLQRPDVKVCTVLTYNITLTYFIFHYQSTVTVVRLICNFISIPCKCNAFSSPDICIRVCHSG